MQPVELIILAVLLGFGLGIWGHRRWTARKLQLKMARARRAEREAVLLLKEQGYSIVDIQRRVPVNTLIAGRCYRGAVRADIIARRWGRKYVVEIKTGKEGDKPGQARTRRQLLEYFLVYRPDGVLLLDMETRRLREVYLEVGRGALGGGRRYRAVAGYLAAFLAGVFLTWLGMVGGR